MSVPLIALDQPDIVLAEVGTEGVKFYLSLELLESAGCFNITQDNLDKAIHSLRKCEVSAFGVFVSWLHCKTVVWLPSTTDDDEYSSTWVFFAQCWQVAEAVDCQEYRGALARTMMAFCKSEKNNYPHSEVQKIAEKILDGKCCPGFWEAAADCLLYHWNSDHGRREFYSNATVTMARYVSGQFDRRSERKR